MLRIFLSIYTIVLIMCSSTHGFQEERDAVKFTATVYHALQKHDTFSYDFVAQVLGCPDFLKKSWEEKLVILRQACTDKNTDLLGLLQIHEIDEVKASTLTAQYNQVDFSVHYWQILDRFLAQKERNRPPLDECICNKGCSIPNCCGSYVKRLDDNPEEFLMGHYEAKGLCRLMINIINFPVQFYDLWRWKESTYFRNPDPGDPSLHKVMRHTITFDSVITPSEAMQQVHSEKYMLSSLKKRIKPDPRDFCQNTGKKWILDGAKNILSSSPVSPLPLIFLLCCKLH